MYKQLTRIHQIEITSRCNLRCRYCPHPTMQREKADMSFSTFVRAMEWVTYFDAKGTQPELSITGIGEALLHGSFLEMLRYARSVYDKTILFSTNGILFTRQIAEVMKELNVHVYISIHRPEVAAPALNLCRELGINHCTNDAFVISSFNWAGKVNWPVTTNRIECSYLKNGWGVVLQNGNVTTCCMDSEEDGVVGHVNDEIGSISVKPYSLCTTCHMDVPEEAV